MREYPKRDQNPPTRDGHRPDEQPEPRVRVPDSNGEAQQDEGRTPTTQEEPEAGAPIGGPDEVSLSRQKGSR